MTFSYSEIHRLHEGNAWIIYGTYTNTEGSEGGEITVLDIHYILSVTLQPTGAAAESDAPTVDEEFTGKPPRINKNTFNIVTVANGCGIWMITGV